jgi:hypothetical protein
MRTTVTFSVRSCLRALDDRDLLAAVRVVSGISGGAVLAAMWAYRPARACHGVLLIQHDDCGGVDRPGSGPGREVRVGIC